MADLRTTAINPNAPIRRDQLPQMTATPRSPRLGLLADALMAARNFANRVQVPQAVPLIGGEGLGSLVLGRAPEELVEMSYGNMPMRVNPYAGRTASFVPEMKPNRGAQVADLLSLAGVPGGGRTAAAMVGGGMADFGAGAERALIGYHGTPHRFAPTPANPLGEFRASQIGTGEGAQAYGYGTYFAESPGVAKEYKTALSGYSADGKRLPSDIGMIVSNYGGDVTAAIADRQGQLDKWLSSGADSKNFVVKGLQEEIKKLSALQGKRLESSGSLYTVDIPDEMIGKMLDWDKPLSQQPKAVRQFFEPLVAPIRKLESQAAGPEWGDLAAPRDYDPLGSELMQLLGKSDEMSATSVLSGGTGGAASSAKLKAAGIPGIRYLDAGSRGPAVTYDVGAPRTDFGPYSSFTSLDAAQKHLEMLKQYGFKDAEIKTVQELQTRNIVVFPGEEQNVKILSRE